MKKHKLAVATVLSMVFLVPLAQAHGAPAPGPNIVLVLSDDVGYGDVGCYGATRVATPNIDRLAAGGLRFTDGHSPAATCTPSRYALLTGEYAFRGKGVEILPGDASLIIDEKRPTLPRMLHDAGYATACIGKWHLGLGRGTVDWNGDIAPGPLELGFDYSFIMPATGDRVPCVYVENHRVVGFDPADPLAVSYKIKVGAEPTGRENTELLIVTPRGEHNGTIVNGISRIGWMAGGRGARWKDDQIADTLTTRAVDFIQKNKDLRFFLYFATHDIHVPRVPGERFAGASQCGVRGDVIQQLDGCVGQLLEALEKLKLAENTLVIFASDNGPAVEDGYADGAARDLNGHKPAGPLRGGKYSIYEGGTRTPLIVYWPGRVKPGVSDALVCHVDLFASLAAMLDGPMQAGAGGDGVNVMAALLGQVPAGREELVEEAAGLALRRGRWKLIPRGTNSSKADGGTKLADELYDLQNDLSESRNVAGEHENFVKEMWERLEHIRGISNQGR